MLVLFRSKSAAEVLMFEQHARPLLLAAGKTFEAGALPERGVITRDQMVQAIAGIEALVANAPADDAFDADDPPHPVEQPVGMRRRAWPLLMMLRLAREKGEDVTWEPAPSW